MLMKALEQTLNTETQGGIKLVFKYLHEIDSQIPRTEACKQWFLNLIIPPVFRMQCLNWLTIQLKAFINSLSANVC